MKMIKVKPLLGVALLFIANHALADEKSESAGSLSMGATRVIYRAQEKEAAMPIMNHTHLTYLIQSWIEDKNGIRAKEFVVTPPLFQLKSQKNSQLRMVAVGNLPQDRESVYYLISKAIPPTPEENKNMLQLAIKTRMKLFYRPEGLQGSPEQSAVSLIWQCNNDNIKIINNSDYSVVIAKLATAAKSVTTDKVMDLIKGGLVPAKDSVTVKFICQSNSQIRYAVMNDFGGITDNLTATLQ
ncbi:molecular chaperone [Atlantibacter subterranea]|nr:molecular chaperone [Atlantibacter subterranea]